MNANHVQMQRTRTRDIQRAARLIWAAGGATSVPKDQKATPAMSTIDPPILHSTQKPSVGGSYTGVPSNSSLGCPFALESGLNYAWMRPASMLYLCGPSLHANRAVDEFL